jgi:Domain of unknown function (DUF4124)
MIWITNTKLIGLTAFCLLLGASGASAQIFQWTDAKGILHFTDNPHWIPESIRNSAALIVRKDLEVKSQPAEEPPAHPATPATPSAFDQSQDETHQTATAVVTQAPQEINIGVVGNSESRQRHLSPCKFGGNCKPAFRANFNDRQYIHPSVFDGGSRQYIHPGSESLPKPTRKRAPGRIR